MKAIIVGAGIGRLEATIGLRRVGADVAVFERAEPFGEVGAGLTLWPNAIKALGSQRVQLGAQCIGFEQDAQSVAAIFVDGRRVSGDLLRCLRPAAAAALTTNWQDTAHAVVYYDGLYYSSPQHTITKSKPMPLTKALD